MNRIDKRFKELSEKNEKAFIGFVTPGCPRLDTTVDLVLSMDKSGLDIIELGIPYSDPIADGKTIQESSKIARENGVKTRVVMDMVVDIRKDSDIPVVLLVYFNSIFAFGPEKFLSLAAQSGVDGIIIPDLPMEERAEILEESRKNDIHLIPLVTPTSRDRIADITKGSGGFVYCVALSGVTGERSEISEDISDYIDSVSKVTDVPKAIGFGISTADMASQYKDLAEGIIIGSAIVKRTLEDRPNSEIIEDVSDFVSRIKNAIS